MVRLVVPCTLGGVIILVTGLQAISQEAEQKGNPQPPPGFELVHSYELPFEGAVRELVLTPDGKHFVANSRESNAEGGDIHCYWLVATNSGELKELIAKDNAELDGNPLKRYASDSELSLLTADDKIITFDLRNLRKSEKVDSSKWFDVVDKFFEQADSPPSMALASPRKAPLPWLVIAPSSDESAGIRSYAWNEQDKSFGTSFEIPDCEMPLFPAAVDKALSLRDESEEQVTWTHIDTWDLQHRKRQTTSELQPPITTIDLQCTVDGKRLFCLEYLVQGIHAYDTSTGKAEFAIQGDGGFAAMAIAADGKRIVAVGGPWVNGVLMSKRVYVYEEAKAKPRPAN